MFTSNYKPLNKLSLQHPKTMKGAISNIVTQFTLVKGTISNIVTQFTLVKGTISNIVAHLHSFGGHLGYTSDSLVIPLTMKISSLK